VASTGPQVKKCVAAFVRSVIAVGSAVPALPRERCLTCRLYYDPKNPPPADFLPSALFQVSPLLPHFLADTLPHSALSVFGIPHHLMTVLVCICEFAQTTEERLSWGSKPLCFPVGTDYQTPYHSGLCYMLLPRSFLSFKFSCHARCTCAHTNYIANLAPEAPCTKSQLSCHTSWKLPLSAHTH